MEQKNPAKNFTLDNYSEHPVSSSLADAEVKGNGTLKEAPKVRYTPLPVRVLHEPFDSFELSEEQQTVIARAKEGNSLFVSGSSGTGKTFLVPFIAKELRDQGLNVQITSSRPDLATLIEGRSLYSICGFKVEQSIDIIKKKIQLKYVQDIWNKIDVVIVDDCELLDPLSLKKILYASRNCGKRKRADVQWIFLGDFFGQTLVRTQRFDNENATNPDKIDFLFELPEWDNTVTHMRINLVETFRHADDVEWCNMLRHFKWGNIQPQIQTIFNTRIDAKLDCVDGILPTALQQKEDLCDFENNIELGKLRGLIHEYKALKGCIVGDKIIPYGMGSVNETVEALDKELAQNSYTGKVRQGILQALETHAPVGETIQLKLRAQVVLVVNLNHMELRLLRGSRGIVVGFCTNEGVLAQGSEEDKIIKTDGKLYPLVRFAKQTVLIRPYMFKVPVTSATSMWYAQIPLKLAWSLNVRSLAGYSLDRAQVNMKDMREYNMAYYIFSKIRSMKDLTVVNFKWSHIKLHPKVEAYAHNIKPRDMEKRVPTKLSTKPSTKQSTKSSKPPHKPKRKKVRDDDDDSEKSDYGAEMHVKQATKKQKCADHDHCDDDHDEEENEENEEMEED